jgi:hypothetical protein
LKKIVADLSLDKEMLQDVLKRISDHKTVEDACTTIGGPV